MKLLKGTSSIQETLLHLLLAAVVTISVLALPLDFLEAPLYDLRLRLSHKPLVDDRIALITIDDQTLNQVNDLNPLPLSYHLRAVQKLEEQQVKAVGYLMDFNKVQRIDHAGFEKEVAQELYRSTVRMNAQGIPFLLGIPFDVNGEVTAPYPLSQVPQAIAIVHRDGTTFGKDKVTRRGLVSLNDRLAFEMALVNKIYPNESILNPPGTYTSSEADAQYFWIQFHQNNNQVYDPNYETFSYPRYSFVDLIEGKIPAGVLKDKIVLVGTFQRDNPNDFTMLNSVQNAQLVPKILVHANILDSILNRQGVKQVSFPYLAILSFLLAFAIIVASFRIRPSRLIQLTLCLLIGTFAISLIILQPFPHLGAHWLPLGAPLISLTFSFYLMIPLRLYSEHRKRFALEKENKSLIDLEEMKTNFLQLVTHDLKTPIAKIQGLTESLKRSLADRLNPKDLELMNHIFLANEDLNQFVNSILELSKIDNHGVRVQLQTKDINQLLEQVILKLRFVSQAKHIQINTDFEPLFAIKIDADLISKVLCNLIDNAIKYSPDGTTVTIKTREVDQFVEIIVKDEGIGISQTELAHLFGRFYRIKNETTQKIKGSGLGLYLSKYFIEAHRGQISVMSSPGNGTEFKILLPLELSETTLPQAAINIRLANLSTNSELVLNKENSNA